MNADHWYAGRQPTRAPTFNHAEFLASLHSPEWMSQGICAQTDPEAWFPEKGGSTSEAKSICGTCDVRAQCLAYAIDHGERFGIWGGLSERERRHMKNNPNAAPRPCARPECTETIPASANLSKRYHEPQCAALAAEDRDVARLDHEPIITAYSTGAASAAKLARTHHVQGGVIARILDQHNVPRLRHPRKAAS